MRYYLNGKQARDTDRYTSETIGIPGVALMERAALELANVISGLFDGGNDAGSKDPNGFIGTPTGCTRSGATRGKRILAVVGTGNNGGDALAAARILKTRGHNAYVYEVNPLGKKTESIQIQEKIAKKLGVEFIETMSENATAEDLASVFGCCDVIIDGIFGVGLSRDVEGIYETATEAINLAKDGHAVGGSQVLSGTGSRVSVEARARNDHAVSSANKPVVVGCDIPSGIDSDSGLIKGCAVKCDITVTFGYTKLGMLINDGRACSGRIICKEIGLFTPGTLEEAKALFDGVITFEYDQGDLSERIPARIPDSNKGTNGKVLIIAGSKDVYGAMYLCTSACCAVGAGLVKVVTHDRNRNLLMDKLPEAMMLTYDDSVTEREDRESACFESYTVRGVGENTGCKSSMVSGRGEIFRRKLADAVAWADVILVGPGLGTDASSRMLLESALAAVGDEQRLVLDADALNILSDTLSENTDTRTTANGDSDNPETQLTTGTADITDLLKKITSVSRETGVVVTPHIGEMLRLMKGLGRDTDAAEIKANPIEAAQWVSEKTGAVCVLKDARTVVSNPKDERSIYINTTGNSGMAKGGSGDVLAGIVAGMLARTSKKYAGVPERKCMTGKDQTGAAEAGYRSGKDKTRGDIFETVCAAVNIHGCAGDGARDKVGETGMRAGNLLDELSGQFM